MKKGIQFLLLTAALVLSGCVKERSATLNQSFEQSLKDGLIRPIHSLNGSFQIPDNTSAEPQSLSSTDRPVLKGVKLDIDKLEVIQTLGIPKRAPGFLTAETYRIDKEVKGISFPKVMGFTTNSKLLNENKEKLELLGEPNQTYKVAYKQTPNRLIIMKVVTEDQLSHIEKPYSDNLGGGYYAVPLAGYSIGLHKLIYEKNSDQELTSRKIPVAVEKLSEAEYMSFHPQNDFTPFSRVALRDKTNVLPVDYFTTGEWYFSESIANTRLGRQGRIGLDLDANDFEGKSASRILFANTKEGLRGYNAAVDDEIDKTDLLKLTPVVTIPTKSLTYRIKETGSGAQLAEEKVDLNTHNNSPYVSMSLKDVVTVRTVISKLQGSVLAGIIKNIDVNQDFFSYTMEENDTGIQYKYAFARVKDRAYKPRRHYQADRNQFGFFTQERVRVIRPSKDSQREDFEKNILIQRLNPEKDVVFHFSELTPKIEDRSSDATTPKVDYREIGRLAVEYWNKAFAEAGAPNGVVLKEDVDAPVGDLRYNTINIIDELAGGGLLGVGPSLTDPYSGEVIYTSSNVHAFPFRSIASGAIRNYLRAQLGVFDEYSRRLPKAVTRGSSLISNTIQQPDATSVLKVFLDLPQRIMNNIADLYHHGRIVEEDPDNPLRGSRLNSGLVASLYDVDQLNLSKNEKIELDWYARHIPEMKNSYVGVNNSKDLRNTLKQIKTFRPTLYRKKYETENFALAALSNLDDDIRNRCTEVNNYISTHAPKVKKGSFHIVDSDQEDLLIKSCSEKIIPEKLLATLVHEMGHNFGLRHNFYCSADKQNYFNKSEVKRIYGLDLPESEIAKSSCVMDYISGNYDRMFFPGPYDIAAIRYGYANAVELATTNGQSKEPLERPLQGEVFKLDPAVQSGLDGDLFMQVAATGKQVRDYKYCSDTKAFIDVDPLCKRHDYGSTPSEIVDYYINSYYESLVASSRRYDRNEVFGSSTRAFEEIGSYYNEWRLRLSEHLSKYLTEYDAESYVAELENLKNNPNFEAKEYFEIRKKIFDFYVDVAMLPNQTCLAYRTEALNDKSALYKNSDLVAFDLKKIKEDLYSKNRSATIYSCYDLNEYTKDGKKERGLVKKYISEKGFTFLTEVGFSVNSVYSLVDPTHDVDSPVEIAGNMLDRLLAIQSMASRSTLSRVVSSLRDIRFNILDEPDLYAELETRILERLEKGVDMNKQLEITIEQLGDKTSKSVSVTDEQLENMKEIVSRIKTAKAANKDPMNYVGYKEKFREEKALLEGVWALFERGANNPIEENLKRTERFASFVAAPNPNLIAQVEQQGGTTVPLGSGRVVVIPDATAVNSLKLANVLTRTSEVLETLKATPEISDVAQQQIKSAYAALTSFYPAGVKEPSLVQYFKLAYDFMKALLQAGPNFDPIAVSVIQAEIAGPMFAPYLATLAQPLTPAFQQIEQTLQALTTEKQAEVQALQAKFTEEIAAFKKAKADAGEPVDSPEVTAFEEAKDKEVNEFIQARIAEVAAEELKLTTELFTQAAANFPSGMTTTQFFASFSDQIPGANFVVPTADIVTADPDVKLKEAVKQWVAKAQATKDEFKYDKDDLSAKQDLLRSILTGQAR